MSTWISSRLAFGAVALTFLSACLGEGTSPTAMSVASPAGKGRSYALAQAAVVPNRVVARGPSGFCVDKRSVKTSKTGGFALLASCAALGAKATGEEEPVLLTIQAQLKGLHSGPTTAEGLAKAFSDNGPIYKETGDGLSLVQLSTGGGEVIPNGEPKHWRAALSFNGYLIGLAVYSEKGGAAANKRGKALLLEFAEGVLGASPLKTANLDAPIKSNNAKRPKLFRNLIQ